MVEQTRCRRNVWVGVLALPFLGIVSGCALVPRERIEETQRLAQSLRTENARLKDEVVNLKAQNRDYADRALDDLRRLTARDEAIERLEKSVQDYQDDRDRLAAAYRRLAVGLGRTTEDSAVESTAWRPTAVDSPRPHRPAERDDRGTESVASEDDEDDAGPPAGTPAGLSGP